MKKLLFSLLMSCPVVVAAVPNAWISDWKQGYEIYTISDSKGQTLTISCMSPVPEDDFDYEHRVELELSKGYLESNELAFLIDGEARYATESRTRNGANEWMKFIESISKGKQIDVYHQNKKLATFKPTKQSIKKLASSIDCPSLF